MAELQGKDRAPLRAFCTRLAMPPIRPVQNRSLPSSTVLLLWVLPLFIGSKRRTDGVFGSRLQSNTTQWLPNARPQTNRPQAGTLYFMALQALRAAEKVGWPISGMRVSSSMRMG